MAEPGFIRGVIPNLISAQADVVGKLAHMHIRPSNADRLMKRGRGRQGRLGPLVPSKHNGELAQGEALPQTFVYCPSKSTQHALNPSIFLTQQTTIVRL